MQIEKALEILILKNDINTLTTDELKEKYCKDGASYRDFLEKFSTIFVGRHLYPLLISEKYSKIEELINSDFSFDSGRVNALCNAISSTIAREKSQCYLSSNEDYNQGIYLFKDRIGATKLKGNYSFDEIIESTLMYASCLGSTTDELSKDELEAYLERAVDVGEVNGDKRKTKTLLDNYFRTHPKANLCYDPLFLVAANYLMIYSSIPVDGEFEQLVKDVIDISETVPSEEIKPDFDSREYHKVAKVTLKRLDEEKKKREGKNNPKQKTKKFFE